MQGWCPGEFGMRFSTWQEFLGVTPCAIKPLIANGRLSSGICAFREVVGVFSKLGAPTV